MRTRVSSAVVAASPVVAICRQRVRQGRGAIPIRRVLSKLARALVHHAVIAAVVRRSAMSGDIRETASVVARRRLIAAWAIVRLIGPMLPAAKAAETTRAAKVARRRHAAKAEPTASTVQSRFPTTAARLPEPQVHPLVAPARRVPSVRCKHATASLATVNAAAHLATANAVVRRATATAVVTNVMVAEPIIVTLAVSVRVAIVPRQPTIATAPDAITSAPTAALIARPTVSAIR